MQASELQTADFWNSLNKQHRQAVTGVAQSYRLQETEDCQYTSTGMLLVNIGELMLTDTKIKQTAREKRQFEPINLMGKRGAMWTTFSYHKSITGPLDCI